MLTAEEDRRVSPPWYHVITTSLQANVNVMAHDFEM
jgi:hypothetical protein